MALADEVESVLRALPLQHRRIIEMRLQGELMHDIAKEVAMSERTVQRVLANLESQLQQRHGLHEKETIRVVARPAANPPDTTAQENDAIRRVSFTDVVLKQLIGAGGMGKVYRAVSKSTGKEMAVKFLRKELQNSPGLVEQFLSEAAVVQRLNHPGLVRLDGIGRTNAGVWFIVMDVIEGQNLADKIADDVPAIERAVGWIIQVAEALRVVHEAGVVHCDLKPANVLVSSDDRVVITDFGLARTTASASNSDATIAGSAPWMAPEQIDPVFGPIDHRTDVYGLGALFFTLLTGQPPFKATRIPDVLAQIVSHSPVPPSQLRSGISPQLDKLCLKCLEKIPERRMGSLADFLQLIESSLPENTHIRRVE